MNWTPEVCHCNCCFVKKTFPSAKRRSCCGAVAAAAGGGEEEEKEPWEQLELLEVTRSRVCFHRRGSPPAVTFYSVKGRRREVVKERCGGEGKRRGENQQPDIKVTVREFSAQPNWSFCRWIRTRAVPGNITCITF